MISIHDQALPPELFAELQKYAQETQFTIVEKGDKKFSVLPTPDYVLPYLEMPGHEIILTFIREATPAFNTEWNRHADNIIEGKKTSFAAVLYLNDESIEDTGTCFWKHHVYGHQLPKNISTEDFDKLINEDSNLGWKWDKTDVIHSRPNRILFYDSSYFHSAWPKAMEKDRRLVLVAFFAKK